MVTVVPRLVAGLMQPRERFPVGADVWADTVVKVPSWRAGSRYLNLRTGEVLASRDEAGVQILPLAEILSDCPIAVLERLT